jgi:membrane protease YdiL (CAAX protease family)
MKTIFHKEFCRKCGKAYDPARGKCPNCDTPSVAFEEVKGFAHMTPMGWGKEIALFLTGWAGFQLIATVIKLIVLSTTKSAFESAGLSGASLQAGLDSFVKTAAYYAAIDFSAYIILFCVLVAIVDRDLYRLTKKFKEGKTYYGILAGVGLYFFSVLYSLLLYATGMTEVNANQSVINEMIPQNPLLSILVFGLIGPFCEELTYRVGFFGFLKRVHPILAYVLCGLIFGLIHMDLTNLGSAVEWAHFPDYVISGVAFCLLYDKLGFGASYLAHATNNLIGVIGYLLSSALSK